MSVLSQLRPALGVAKNGATGKARADLATTSTFQKLWGGQGIQSRVKPGLRCGQGQLCPLLWAAPGQAT